MYRNYKKLINIVVWILVVTLLAIFGTIYVSRTGITNRTLAENNSLMIAEAIAVSLNDEMIKNLKGSPEDEGTFAYNEIKSRLTAAFEVVDNIRFAYLYTLRKDIVYLLADSEPSDSKDYSPPGQEYTEAAAEYHNAFENGKSLVTQPVSDRWGEWISFLVPLKHHQTGKVIAVFGMDYPAEKFYNNADSQTFITGMVVFVVWLLLISLIVIISRNRKLKKERLKTAFANKKIRISEEQYRLLIEQMQDGLAVHEIIKDEGGKAVDYRFLSVNKSYETLTGLSGRQIIGKTVLEVLPGTENYWIESYGSVALTGKPLLYENYSKELKQWFSVSAYSPLPGQFVTIVQNITKRKEMEKNLKESEAKFRSYIENAPYGIFIADRNGRYIETNPEASHITGYTSAELRGMSISEILPPESQQAGMENFEHLIATGRSFGEFAFIHASGNIRYWRVSAARLSETRFLGFVEDISERKQADEEFRKNEEDLKESQRIAHVGSWRLDIASNEVIWSEELYRMYGFDPAVPPPPYTEHQKLFTPESWVNLSTALAHTTDTGIPYELELETVRDDGSNGWMWVHGEAVLDSKGKTISLRGAAQDITARKKSEEENMRLMSAITQAGESIIITDIKGSIEYVNPAFETITGYTREEVLGKNPRILKSGIHNETFYTKMWETLMQGETWKGRLYNRKKDGISFTEDAVISPVRDEKGRTVNYVAVKRDITETLHNEEQLLQSQKLDSIGRLAGGVAHDFNNMLGVVLGHTEIALEQLSSADPLFSHFIEIRMAAERSANLTRQLLAFARKQTVAPKVLNLNDTIAQMLQMLQRLIGEDIDLTWLPAADLRLIKIDPSQVDQILVNLCINARDSIQNVGKITIETETVVFDEHNCIDLLDCVPGEYVRLVVKDDGSGMDEKTLNRLFEPFFTTKEVGEGIGLGLATVYGIVKQNNGFINVTSEQGLGTAFTLYLPSYVDLTEKITDVHPEKLIKSGSETILLVEDESSILKMVTLMLESKGYTVLPAASANEAIRLAESYSGDIRLLMTDVVMPEMNGLDLALNLSQSFPNLRRLFMSGYTADVIAHHGVLDDGVDFIQKPFTMKDLAAKVREVLDN